MIYNQSWMTFSVHKTLFCVHLNIPGFEYIWDVHFKGCYLTQKTHQTKETDLVNKVQSRVLFYWYTCPWQCWGKIIQSIQVILLLSNQLLYIFLTYPCQSLQLLYSPLNILYKSLTNILQLIYSSLKAHLKIICNCSQILYNSFTDILQIFRSYLYFFLFFFIDN